MAALRVVIALLLLVGVAHAHDVRPGAITLIETAPNTFQMRLVAPLDGAGPATLEPPTLPDGCGYASTDQVRCAGGLDGALTLPRLARRRVKLVVHVRWLDGRRFEGLLREGETTIDLAGPALGLAAVRLGVSHILAGWDHLLFVLALALIAGSTRRIAVAITGFTIGHSVTLAATVMDVVRPPGAATELFIAASVLFLAAEAARGRSTLTARYPIGVALIFGGIHGFGFAGALTTLEMPPDTVLSTVLGFNLGVEIGQLAILLGAVLLARLVGPRIPAARTLAAYALGIPAAAWTIQRAAIWWTG